MIIYLDNEPVKQPQSVKKALALVCAADNTATNLLIPLLRRRLVQIQTGAAAHVQVPHRRARAQLRHAQPDLPLQGRVDPHWGGHEVGHVVGGVGGYLWCGLVVVMQGFFYWFSMWVGLYDVLYLINVISIHC